MEVLFCRWLVHLSYPPYLSTQPFRVLLSLPMECFSHVRSGFQIVIFPPYSLLPLMTIFSKSCDVDQPLVRSPRSRHLAAKLGQADEAGTQTRHPSMVGAPVSTQAKP
eukprot:COSAG06_NODE_4896_length_3875_cov_26.188030_2_plen_108_part_00